MKKILFILSFLLALTQLYSQDDLLDILDEEVEEEPMEVAYTFKSTRIINGHSIERMVKKQLDFRINHRFGQINQGAYDLWGLDNALISFDFGYGITDNIMLGIRRSTAEKTYDASLKLTLLRQMTGAKNIPVAVSYYTNIGLPTLKDEVLYPELTSRLSYVQQLLIARKFNEKLSLQIMPTYVHRNIVDYDETNDIISVGIGGRYKFHRRVALMFEYFWTNQSESLFDDEAVNPNFDPIALGFDIETGGHVFQLFFTNARIMEEAGFLAETTSNPLDGGIYFGFNISRVFAIGGSAH